MGFNYFRDEKHRLLEDYWNSDKPDGWPKFERDFREMKWLGANVVRVHLQFAKFMDAPGKPNEENVARLAKVIDLADATLINEKSKPAIRPVLRRGKTADWPPTAPIAACRKRVS